MFNALVKRGAPWLVGIVLFWGVCYYFFAPQFDDKSLGQGDIAQYAGMSEDIHEHRSSTGEDPQWTGNMFSGMPAYLIDVEYPTQDVKQSVGSTVKVVDGPMNMILFAMILMMVAAVLMGINPWIGIIAGLAYGLSTYFFLIIDAGHITKMWALVYAPPLVAAVWYTLRRNMWVGAALAALFGSLELGANHPQITYYFLIAAFALWLSEMWFAYRNHTWRMFGKRTALLAVAALLAAGSNFAPLWYTMKHQSYTTRAESEVVDEAAARQERIAYNTAWSYGPKESFNMLVPSYMGGWSGDYSDEVIAQIQGAEIQNAIYDLALEELTLRLREEIPGLLTSDTEYYLSLGDEALMEEFGYIYDSKFNDVSAYASNYWGEQPYTAGPTYLGAVAIFLALVGVMLIRGRMRWWIVATTLFALLLAWGSHIMGFYELMYDILPGYKSFRTVSMALVVAEWSIPLLAAMALNELLNTELSAKQLIRRVAIAFAVVVVLVATMWAVADYGLGDIYERLGEGIWVEQLREAAYEARSSAFLADATRTMLYVAMASAVLIGYVVVRERKRTAEGSTTAISIVAMVLVAGIMVADLMGVDSRYMNDDKWSTATPTEMTPTSADRVIMADNDLGFRVLDLSSDPFNSARASYFHRSVGGYHGAKLGRYQDIIDEHLAAFEPAVLAMLNTRYVIYNGQALPLSGITGIEPYGAAWFVDSVECVATPREALEALRTTNLTEVAIVEGDTENFRSYYDTTGTIELTDYAPNRLRYEYSSSADCFAVFSEIYFPDGWSVTVDGVEADYICVDYTLRGMELPAGEHIVEWQFKAPCWGMSTAITGIASWAILVALLLVIAIPIVRYYRESKKR